MRIVVALFAIAFLAFSCTKENLKVEDSVKVYSFSDIDLKQGVSKWLNEEQKARFSEAELAELDALVAEEKLPVTIESRAVIEVPAESKDALALAIAEAGEGGTVILKAGNHYESSTVNVRQTVTIRGEEGAVLISDVLPTNITTILEPAFHIQGTKNVVIIGLTMQPAAAVGGTGILVDNAPRCYFIGNTMKDFQFGIMIEQGDFTRVINNKISTSPAWQTGELTDANGIVVSNGKNTRLIGNEFQNSFLGAFTCDLDGLFLGNVSTNNAVGLLVCNLPFGVAFMPDGRTIGASTPGSNWLVLYNKCANNFTVGFLVIDGAKNNYLNGNEGGNNGTYDFELAGESLRFGFLTPPSVGNRAIIGSTYTVKDCGVDNIVTGGIKIDTAVEPCN